VKVGDLLIFAFSTKDTSIKIPMLSQHSHNVCELTNVLNNWYVFNAMPQTAKIKTLASKWSTPRTVMRVLRQFVFTCVRWSITISFSRAGQVMGPADAYAILLLALPSTTNRSLTIHVITRVKTHFVNVATPVDWARRRR
jgi:hypothetical protein